MSTPYLRSDLSAQAKRALIILLEEGVMELRATWWRSPTDRKCGQRTIDTLYGRYLIKIVVESRHRSVHKAMLTPVGEYAARELKRQLDDGTFVMPKDYTRREQHMALNAEIVETTTR